MRLEVAAGDALEAEPVEVLEPDFCAAAICELTRFSAVWLATLARPVV